MPGHVVVEHGAQRLQVDEAAVVGGDGDDLVAAEGDRRRVRPVGRVRDHDPWRDAAVGVVVGAHQQEPGQLAGRAGRRLQRRGVHAGDRAQGVLELHEQLEPPLARRAGVAGWTSARPGQGGDLVADLRVVLHRARPERVGAEVDRELPVLEPGEVRHQVALGHLGQRDRLVAPMPRGPARERRPGTPVVRSWQPGRPGSESSKSVGSASAPEQRRARRAARPAAAAGPPSDRSSRTALASRAHEGVDLGLGPPLGHRDEEAVRRRRPRATGHRRRRPVGDGHPAEKALVDEPVDRDLGRIGRRTANSRKDRAVRRRSTPPRPAAAPGSSACPGRSAGPPRPARRPQPAELDGRGDRHQGLVRADVRRRLLAADVLLARPQRRHVARRALDVDRLADEPARAAGGPGREATGEQPEVRAAEAERRCRAPGPRRRRRRRRTRPARAARRRRPGRPRRRGARRWRRDARAAATSSRHPR